MCGFRFRLLLSEIIISPNVNFSQNLVLNDRIKAKVAGGQVVHVIRFKRDSLNLLKHFLRSNEVRQ